MPATTTGAPFSLNIPSVATDAADLFGLYLKPNMTALNTNAAHKGTAQTFSALQTFSAGLTVSAGVLTAGDGLTVSAGALTAAAGLTVSAGGATITGNSTITGTLTGLTGLTVASGGATVTAGGLTVTAGGATINGGGITVGSTGGNVGIGGSPSYRLHLLGETDQYPTALYIAPSGHATSRRAGAAIDDWLLAQATAGNGTKDFGIYQGASATWRMLITTGGNVGINQTSPGSALDVKGTLRLSGSTSGYVGLAPAAAAGSVTYTLPTADGSAGQMLQTNGAGTLSWGAAGGGGGGARAMLLMGA